jgi:GTPase SAR1 family protein
VLRCRVKTTGIVETEFEYNGFKFKLFDVGGQRNERKKWIHCFDNVTAVIFVTAMSEYDLKCYEDDSTMRMKESLVLFDEICNSRYFQDTDIILFFNKLDLFKEKIKNVDLKVCFPDYTGGCDYDSASKYIEKEFRDRNQDDGKEIYAHFTCATDTNNIKNVFDNIKEIILKNNIKN